MKTFTYYKTVSYGGCDGCERIERKFETIEEAMRDAKNDDWNSDFTLYEVAMTINGRITETERKIGDIFSARDEKHIKHYESVIARAEANIEEHKANKRIKEKTRTERIKYEQNMIEAMKNSIEKIKNKIK